jgi:hypothetical protein
LQYFFYKTFLGPLFNTSKSAVILVEGKETRLEIRKLGVR